MNVKKLLLALPALCLAAAASGQQPVPVLTYKVDYIKDQIGKSAFTSICRFRILEKLPEGKLRMEATRLNCRQLKSLQPPNTASLMETGITDTEILFNLLLLQQPVELIFDPARTFLPQPALEKLLEQKAAEYSLKPEIVKTLAGNLPAYLSREMHAAFSQAPANASSWQSADSTLLYSATGGANGIRLFSATRNPAKQGPGNIRHVSNNTYKWDAAGGKLLEAYLTYRASGNSQGGNNAPFRYADTMRMELLDTPVNYPAVTPEHVEWLIKTSRWSYALNDAKGFDYDSLKVIAFLQKMDPLFSGEKGYIANRLDLVQGILMRKHYDDYAAVLRNTPNEAMQGSASHLHNKLQNVWYENTDSAMQLLEYLAEARPKSAEDWLQYSLAQGLFVKYDSAMLAEATASWKAAGESEEKIAALRHQVSIQAGQASTLIGRATQSGHPVVRNASRPMYLSHQAELQGHPDSLHAIAQQFRSLSPIEKKSGNAGRYALMLYKTLEEKGQRADADIILKEAIAALEKGATDTLSKRRFTDQNMLAYAYYLQYEALKPTDKRLAMTYLSKASAISPRSSTELTNDSFYDRVMLKSKESYREEFAAALVKEGDTKEAMKVLAQEINAEPGILPMVQQSFAKYLPNLDFKDFITNTLTRSWKEAPDFTLAGYNGGTYKLSDFRGKWVLLDFWGTWCNPCRKELPQIDQVAKSLQNSPNEAFLSIACFDTPEKVNRLLTGEGYTFPVAMSDNKVQLAFNVTGYPTKFIISPDGKMLPVAFSQDWKSIFEQFSNLQNTAVKPADKNAGVNKRMN